MKQRVCREPSCVTLLSRFNPGDRCWNHTDYKLADRNMPTADRPHDLLREVFADDFLIGLAQADALTPVEAEWYRRDWEAS